MRLISALKAVSERILEVHILEARKVTKTFGGLAAVDDLSFRVKRGEIFGIAGPNGSGKSTLFNVINGFYSCTGDIVFENEKINGLKPHQICRKGIARIFQVPNLFSTFTVFENIRVGAHFGSPGEINEDENIQEILTFVRLKGKQNNITANLNLFDKKKTMIGAALATRPKLLMVDEPIGGLSPMETTESIELFKRINREMDVTIVIIEHMMKVLAELSERLMILDNGSRICIGRPAEVGRDEGVIRTYLGGGYHA
jgi:branched-chain amino acid transport system ATP-binding protein